MPYDRENTITHAKEFASNVELHLLRFKERYSVTEEIAEAYTRVMNRMQSLRAAAYSFVNGYDSLKAIVKAEAQLAGMLVDLNRKVHDYIQ